MRPVEQTNPSHHCLAQITQDTTDVELEVLHWFAAGHEILWIPICEVSAERSGTADVRAETPYLGGPRLIRNVTDFYRLPKGIKGWLFPAHLDDTDVVCTRTAPWEVTFGSLIHPITKQRLTYRFPTEEAIPSP